MIRTGLLNRLVVRQGLTRRIYGAADAGLKPFNTACSPLTTPGGRGTDAPSLRVQAGRPRLARCGVGPVGVVARLPPCKHIQVHVSLCRQRKVFIQVVLGPALWVWPPLAQRRPVRAWGRAAWQRSCSTRPSWRQRWRRQCRGSGDGGGCWRSGGRRLSRRRGRRGRAKACRT